MIEKSMKHRNITKEIYGKQTVQDQPTDMSAPHGCYKIDLTDMLVSKRGNFCLTFQVLLLDTILPICRIDALVNSPVRSTDSLHNYTVKRRTALQHSVMMNDEKMTKKLIDAGKY